ncbi:MAG TPA: LysR family transcriptional regulator [Chloroflexota bacterium]|nr:LysR family transcriptional regulator [Chloroflexota bacterium]
MFTFVELQILALLEQGKTLHDIGALVHLGHPAVSKTLQAAERKAGFQLVEHHGRRLRLTTPGQEIARMAAVAVEHIREFQTATDAMRMGTKGLLRVIANRTPGSYVLPPVVGAFAAALPEARLELEVATPAEIWSKFSDEGYDVAVAQSTPPEPLQGEWLYDDEMQLYAAAESALVRRAAVGWDDLRGQTIIGPDLVLEQLRQMNPGPDGSDHEPRMLVVMSQEAVNQLIQDGSGIGFLYQSMASKDVAAGRLRPLPTDNLGFRQSYWLVRRPSPRPLPLVERFCGLLLAHAGSLKSPQHPAARALTASQD